MGNKGEYALGLALLALLAFIMYKLSTGAFAGTPEPENSSPPPASPPPPAAAPPSAPAGPPSTGFEDDDSGSQDTSYQRPPAVAVTSDTCMTDHVGTYFENGQCIGCPSVTDMHEDISASRLRCDSVRGSTVEDTPITLDSSVYGGVPISGGPESFDVNCKLTRYYNITTDGLGRCLPFEGGACNDEYCAEGGVDGNPVTGVNSREDCAGPDVWVGKFHSGRGPRSEGECNVCNLTENTIDYVGGSRTSFFNSLECEACHPGPSKQYVSNDGECVICPDDHVYSEGPPATCTECTGGRSYINPTTSVCGQCPHNKYYNATNKTCVNKIGGGLNHPCGTGSLQNVCNAGFECNETYVPSESVCKISLYNAGGGICRNNAECIGKNPGWGTGSGLNRDCSSATRMPGDRCVD
jgi:hypothetical protein